MAGHSHSTFPTSAVAQGLSLQLPRLFCDTLVTWQIQVPGSRWDIMTDTVDKGHIAYAHGGLSDL